MTGRFGAVARAVAFRNLKTFFTQPALVVPGLTARLILGSDSPTARALLRMVGIRDVALGVGAITNLKERNQDAEWVSMGALADGGDALAMWLAPIGWRRVANALFAKSMAAVGLLCARQLASERVTAEG